MDDGFYPSISENKAMVKVFGFFLLCVASWWCLLSLADRGCEGPEHKFNSATGGSGASWSPPPALCTGASHHRAVAEVVLCPTPVVEAAIAQARGETPQQRRMRLSCHVRALRILSARCGGEGEGGVGLMEDKPWL
jgi:hypothetical protein